MYIPRSFIYFPPENNRHFGYAPELLFRYLHSHGVCVDVIVNLHIVSIYLSYIPTKSHEIQYLQFFLNDRYLIAIKTPYLWFIFSGFLLYLSSSLLSFFLSLSHTHSPSLLPSLFSSLYLHLLLLLQSNFENQYELCCPVSRIWNRWFWAFVMRNYKDC